jgi:hypothetical protein
MSNADAMAACHCRFFSPCLSAGFDDRDCDLEEFDPASNAHDGAAQLARDGYAAYESGEPSDHATRLPESDDGIVDDERIVSASGFLVTSLDRHPSSPNDTTEHDPSFAELVTHHIEYLVAAGAVGSLESAFHDSIGSEPGTVAWRVERFTLVNDIDAEQGLLFSHDVYIVLSTDEQLKHTIYTWIGALSRAERAVVASFKAVELARVMLARRTNSSASQVREEQGSESKTFMGLFGGDVTYFTGDDGTGKTTTLTRVRERREKRRCLEIVVTHNRKHKWRLVERAPVIATLRTSAVLLLDSGGGHIHHWTGIQSSATQRAALFEAAHCWRTERVQRSGRCEIQYDRQGEESKEFWELLDDGHTLNESEYRERLCAREVPVDKAPPPTLPLWNAVLSLWTNNKDVLPAKVAPPAVTRAKSSLYEMHNNDMEKLALNPLLYRVSVESRGVRVGLVDGELKKMSLKSDGAFILDCGSAIFVWIGRRAGMGARFAASQLARRLTRHSSRWPFASLTEVGEGHEPFFMTSQFDDDMTSRKERWLGLFIENNVAAKRGR